MHVHHTLWRWTAAAVLACSQAAPAVAQQAGPFDGTWNVIFTCPATPGGTAGYTRRFLASVRGGVMHGEIGVDNQAGFLALDGSIQLNGTSVLDGHGFTGDPNYVVGRSPPATPYHFHLQARFSTSNGTGSRTEVRRCDAVFSKQ